MAEQKSYFSKTIIAADAEGIPTVLLTGIQVSVYDENDELVDVLWNPDNPVLTITNPFPVTNGTARFWALPAHYRVHFDDTQVPERIAPYDYYWDAVSTRAGGTSADILENSTIASNQLALAVQRSLLPVGVILPYAATAAPAGFLICNGGEHPVATYPALDALLGTTYGPRTNGAGGAGATHFRVPNLAGRLPVGAGAGVGEGASGAAGTIPAGSGLTTRALGEWAGREAVTLTSAQSGVPVHGHGASSGDDSPDHAHHMEMLDLGGAPPSMIAAAGGKNVWRMSGALGGGGTNPAVNDIQNNAAFDYGLGVAGATARHQHPITVNNNAAADAASSHTNLPPILTVNYIIRNGL